MSNENNPDIRFMVRQVMHLQSELSGMRADIAVLTAVLSRRADLVSAALAEIEAFNAGASL